MPDFQLVAEGLQFPEGPLATSDGRVLLVEIPARRLSAVDVATGEVRPVADCDGGPNGAAVGPGGQIVVCNSGGQGFRDVDGVLTPGAPPERYIGGRIQVVDPATGAVRDLYERCGGNALSSPNDLVFDRHGGFWFTDLGRSHPRQRDHGGVYYALPDGSRIEEALYPLTMPNGVGLSPAGDRLYVSETGPGRLWAWDLDGPGRVARSGPGPHGATLLWGFEGFQMLDSLAVDSAGNVCVATLYSGTVSVVGPDGRLLEQLRVADDDPFVTNVCFGGEDLRTMYVTTSGRGRLYATTWPVPGTPLAHAL